MISVIVPMYNARDTIERCLLSIINQSYQDLEIIVIDDGSTDEGRNIVDGFAKKDRRIKYIWQDNHGVSSARNHGLDTCTGEFICFVDSDDAIMEDYISSLYNSIRENQSDVAMCGYCEVTEEKKIDHLLTEEDERSLQGLIKKDLYILRHFMCTPWMKIFRRDMIRKFHLRFREDMALAEDQYFNFQYYELCHTVSFVNQPNYIYYHNSFGLSGAVSLHCFNNELENLSYEIMFMEGQQIEKRGQMIADYICYLVRRYIFIPDEKNTGSAAISRLKKINLYHKPVKLPNRKDNMIYNLLLRKQYHLIYLYKKISTNHHFCCFA